LSGRYIGATSWFLGTGLGFVVGAGFLVAGVFAVVFLAPALVWSANERARPFGLGGMFIGLGAGVAGLVALADARCAASSVSTPHSVSTCAGPDLTAFFAAAAVLAAVGAGVSLVAAMGSRPHGV
jgi:chromate transport protein ChrA